MKTYLLAAIFFVSAICSAQITQRTLIDGQVNVPAGQDPSGITVYNVTSQKGTVTDDDGSFRLAVALEDEIRFFALQYEEFTLRVDQNILDAGQLEVFISEGLTELPEVRIGEPDLTGRVEVDVRRIPVEKPNLPEATTAAEINEYEWNFRPDEKTVPLNAAMRSSMMRNGLNFANLFRGIYSSRVTGSGNTEPLEEDVRSLYDDAFFRENLEISRENIPDFITYAETQGLDEEMMEEGNELDLIQFLIDTSREYKLRVEEGEP